MYKRQVQDLKADLVIDSGNTGSTNVITSTDSLSIVIDSIDAGNLSLNAGALNSDSIVSLAGGYDANAVYVSELNGTLNAALGDGKSELASSLSVNLNETTLATILTGTNNTAIYGGDAVDGDVTIDATNMLSSKTLDLGSTIQNFLTAASATVVINSNLNATYSTSDLSVTVSRAKDAGGVVSNTDLLNIITGRGNDSLVIAGPAAVKGGDGADRFTVLSGNISIIDLGFGNDQLLNYGGAVTAVLQDDWIASSSSSLGLGTTSIDSNGHNIDLSLASTSPASTSVTVSNSTSTSVEMWGTAAVDSLVAGSGGDSLHGSGGNDILVGGAGVDTFYVDKDADTVRNVSGSDNLVVSNGATANVTLSGTWSASGGTVNDGIASFTTAGYAVDLHNALGTKGFKVIDTGLTAISLVGSANADSLTAGSGGDTLHGGLGVDTLTGGSGQDIFDFHLGDSVLTTVSGGSGFDVIKSFAKSASTSILNGDMIYLDQSLSIGGSASAPTASEASINQTTGIASFASGSGGTLADALGDIAQRFTNSVGGTNAGQFAFFKVNNSGNYYMFISDGNDGLSSDDVAIQLSGLTAITSVIIHDANHVFIV